MEEVDDLGVLNVQDSIRGIAANFHIISETLIVLLLDGLQGFGGRWTLVCALEVADEHGT
jgi:hypothetical protein